MLDKLTYAGPPREPRGPAGALRADRGRHLRPRRSCARRWRAATRSSTSPPSPTSTARSRTRAPSSRTDVFGTYVLLEAARDARHPPPAGLHRRGLRLDRVGLLHRDLAARPLLALLGVEGGRRPDRLRLPPHLRRPTALIVRASNNYGPRQYPEKLIPLIVLNALHGDPMPVYGDGAQVRNWLFVEDFCRGDRHRARARRGRARPTTSAGPTSCRTSRWSSGSSR